MINELLQWIIVTGDLYKRRRYYQEYVRSHIYVRQKLLNRIQSLNDGPDTDDLLTYETSYYLKQAKRLLNKGEIDSALRHSYWAERRLFFYTLYRDGEGFDRVTEVKKEWHKTYLRTRVNKLQPSEREMITQFLNSKCPTDEQWKTVVTISTNLRSKLLTEKFRNDMKYDKIVLHLFGFSFILLVLIGGIIILAANGGDVLLTENDEIQRHIFDRTLFAGTENGIVATVISMLLNGLLYIVPLLLIFSLGAFGAAISGTLSTRETELTQSIDPEGTELEIWMMISRVLLGAGSAFVLVLVARAGIINMPIGNTDGSWTWRGMAALAFVAGFSEQLLTRSIEAANLGEQVEDDPQIAEDRLTTQIEQIQIVPPEDTDNPGYQ